MASGINENVPLINKQLFLVKRPDKDFPQNVDTNFELRIQKLPSINDTQLENGKVLLENLFLSVDPTMRVWMTGARTYIPPVNLNTIFPSGSVSRVLKSSVDNFKKGDVVLNASFLENAQTYITLPSKAIQKLPAAKVKPQHFLGPFGINGLTAYIGLYEIGKLKKDDKVVISTAAGSVGEIAVQLAKNTGCYVVGIAGGKSKCDYVKSLGADECIDYKVHDNEEKLTKELKKLFKSGIDVYFDNVGAYMLDSVLNHINEGARIICCGAISGYNTNDASKTAIKNYPKMIIKRARMQGYIYFDHKAKFPEALTVLITLYMQGKLKFQEDVLEGLENFPNALKKLFTGTNKGKTMVAIQSQFNATPKL